MITKEFLESEGRVVARVTFTIPDSVWADSVMLVGDFNRWDRKSHPLTRTRGGEWIIAIDLEVNRAYQFRYLFDGEEWINDNSADAYVPTEYGSCNFVVVTVPRSMLCGIEENEQDLAGGLP